MSAQAMTPEQRTYNFATPTALNVEVLGTDNLTGQGFITLAAANAMLRGILSQGSGAKGFIILKRDGKEVRRWSSDLLLSSQQGPNFPGFPLTVRAGQVQLYYVQTSGTLAAATLDMMWAQSLVPVVI